ncbi:MAG: 6-carboxytetrahydropterin synthase [Methanobacteriaceae archaeon]
MKIIVNGIHANLRFSAAHIIPSHESCGCIHGHSYIVDVELIGERSGDFDFVVDFKKVKEIVRGICKKFDHKVLIPLKNSETEFKDIATIEDAEKVDSIKFKIANKKYVLPKEDCVLLPLPHSSAEELAKYFTEELFKTLTDDGNKLEYVAVCVNEGIGQGAEYSISS